MSGVRRFAGEAVGRTPMSQIHWMPVSRYADEPGPLEAVGGMPVNRIRWFTG